MGYDASVYVVYGIPFDYGSDTGDALVWLLEFMLPEAFKEEGPIEVWDSIDLEPHTGGYYLINFTNDGKLFVACWFVQHQVVRDRGDPQLLEMPTEHKKEKFLNWCTNNNIDTSKAGFYTIIGD